MLVKKAEVVPIECVARGYLAGSGWKEYQAEPDRLRHQAAAGAAAVRQAPGADLHARDQGGAGPRHQHLVRRGGAADRRDTAGTELRDGHSRSTRRPPITRRARGVIIADTKFEFGRLPDGRLILIDEVLTPDSSRFWPADKYEPGHDQPSFDKQYVRNWLETQPWDKTPPAPDAAEGCGGRNAAALPGSLHPADRQEPESVERGIHWPGIRTSMAGRCCPMPRGRTWRRADHLYRAGLCPCWWPW